VRALLIVGLCLLLLTLPAAVSADLTHPPGNITFIAALSTHDQIGTWWINPPDTDFAGTQIWLDNTYITQLPAPSNFTYFEFLALGDHTISTKTIDSHGNVNPAWNNITVSNGGYSTCIEYWYHPDWCGGTPTGNFTNIADILSNQWVYNRSSIIANQPLLMVTEPVWLALIFLGVGLLVLSALGKLGVMQDLAAILASIFLGVASVGSWAVDTVTGYGVLTSGTRYVLMENHTIYHYDLYGYVLEVAFLISLLNLYRLSLDYRRVTKQEAMEREKEEEKECR
jgi:hypothetical protein